MRCSQHRLIWIPFEFRFNLGTRRLKPERTSGLPIARQHKWPRQFYFAFVPSEYWCINGFFKTAISISRSVMAAYWKCVTSVTLHSKFLWTYKTTFADPLVSFSISIIFKRSFSLSTQFLFTAWNVLEMLKVFRPLLPSVSLCLLGTRRQRQFYIFKVYFLRARKPSRFGFASRRLLTESSIEYMADVGERNGHRVGAD